MQCNFLTCSARHFKIFVLALMLPLSGYSLAEPDPNEYAVLGIQLGMTPEEVEATAESAGFRNIKDNRLSVTGDDTIFIDHQLWAKRGSEWGDLRIVFTRPPAESRVMLVQGGIKGQQFPDQQLQEALIGKYGEPTEVKQASAATIYYWYHGGENDGERCDTVSPQARNAEIYDCSGIQLKVQMGKRQGQNGMIYSLGDSALADMGLIEENTQAFEEYATEIARQREAERMQNVDAPKF